MLGCPLTTVTTLTACSSPSICAICFRNKARPTFPRSSGSEHHRHRLRLHHHHCHRLRWEDGDDARREVSTAAAGGRRYYHQLVAVAMARVPLLLMPAACAIDYQVKYEAAGVAKASAFRW